jgi:hypothetical protein
MIPFGAQGVGVTLNDMAPAPHQCHAGPLYGKLTSHRSADTGATAGNQRNFALKSTVIFA